MGEYDKKPAKAAATAGPANDDRYGPGILAKDLQARIISKAVHGDEVAITIAAGSTMGVRVNMEGYIQSGGGMLAEFHITEVQPRLAIARVRGIVADQVDGVRYVRINPTSRPRVALDPKTRLIAVTVEDGQTKITIPRGKLHGVTEGMTGELVSGDPHGGFTIDSVDTVRSSAYLKQTVEYARAHPEVLLHTGGPARGSQRGGASVQRRATGAAATGDVQATAQAGVAGAAGRLPHFDTIQRAFGKHDISGIQAQVGGPAADASRSLGAHAYATGNKVAFASAPDLHTAAHEAAHTIQQSRGAVGFQGLGAADDEHERHADAVADAVVAGQSAESLLERNGGGTGATSAVQRKESDKDSAAKDFVKGGDIATDVAARRKTTLTDLERVKTQPLCAREPGRDGCFLDPEERRSVLQDIDANRLTAATNFKDACLAVGIELLLKKEEDLHWIAGIALDVAGGLIVGGVTKALLHMRATHAKAVYKAVEYGDDPSKLSERIAGLSKESIESRVKASGAFLTKQGKSLVTTASNEDAAGKRQAQKSYLGQLQDDVDTNYREFFLNLKNNATDGELEVFQKGMVPDNHKPSEYKATLEAKLKRYMESGVTNIGRRVLDSRRGPLDELEHAGDIEDRRVAWVSVGGERQLFFQLHHAGDNPNTIKPGEPDYGAFYPKHKATFGERDGETKLGKPVPDEFRDVALAASEARWGTTPRLVVSKEKFRELTGYNPPDKVKNPSTPSQPKDARGGYGPTDLASDVEPGQRRGYSPSDLKSDVEPDTRGGYGPNDLASDIKPDTRRGYVPTDLTTDIRGGK